MAIRMMTREDKAGSPNVETVRDYRGHEEFRWHHGFECPNRNNDHEAHEGRLDGCEQWCKPFGPLYMETTRAGLVLRVGEHNYRDDSDFYAIVWNPETERPEEIEYASTRGWTYPNDAAVDATPEVLAAYEAYRAEAARVAREAREEAEKKAPRVGKTARVVGGRKVPIGTTGRIFWVGVDRFKAPRYGPYAGTGPERVGIESGGTKYFTAAGNIEVLAGEAAEA